jgi:hypothetical protein
MKSKLLIVMALSAISFTTNAQTKGTSAVGFGVNTNSQESMSTNTSAPANTQSIKTNSFSIGYGYFFKDNEKIGLELNYGINKTNFQNSQIQEFENYGANISYQKYYPIFKKLFAHAGGNVAYTYGKQSEPSSQQFSYTSNQYLVGAFGGISWFVSKRFALETNLLSTNFGYSETTIQNQQNFLNTTKSNSFNLNTQGFFNNLGFKIYILF